MLQLLGKLGARNRRWLKAPQRLPYRDNTEHGLRVVLTLQPATAFLVPLDKCLVLAQDSLRRPDPGAHWAWCVFMM